MADHEQHTLSVKEQVALLPSTPGVYQFLNRAGEIIYVGKAKNLKKRVSSYFMESREHAPKIRMMVRQIAALRHIDVPTEQDALLLENSLIKTLQPRYNTMLKDDKTYPWIVVRNEPFPRVMSTRRLVRDGSQYFGPYSSVMVQKNMLDLIHGIYQAPHLFPEPLARSDSPGQIRRMPGVPHRQLQGAVRRPAERRGLRRRHRTDKEDAAGRPALHTRVPAPADDGGRGGA